MGYPAFLSDVYVTLNMQISNTTWTDIFSAQENTTALNECQMVSLINGKSALVSIAARVNCVKGFKVLHTRFNPAHSLNYHF